LLENSAAVESSSPKSPDVRGFCWAGRQKTPVFHGFAGRHRHKPLWNKGQITADLENVWFSTVFSTVVENSGNRPNDHDLVRGVICLGKTPTVTQNGTSVALPGRTIFVRANRP